MESTLLALQTLMSWDLILIMVMGITIGVIPGILPGIGGAATMALALPFVLYLSELQTLVLLCSLYTGVGFGGSITSILVGIPGTGSAVPVMFDGHRMAKAGRADFALGASLASVATGNAIGALFLIFLIGPMAAFAIRFGPVEILMVILIAILMIGTIRGRSAWKGILTGVFGIMVSTVGLSPYGHERGTMGSIYLFDGFPTIALLVAMFTVPGIVEMCMARTIERTASQGSSLKSLLKGMVAPFRYRMTALTSAIIGLCVGILPAVGGNVGSLLAYNLGRTYSPRGHKFATGNGHEEGIVACETANGSDEGGSLATMFVLGLPAGATTAVMLGALMLHGWAVGPKMVFDHWNVIQTVIWAELIQAMLLVPIGLVFCFYAWRIVRVRTIILAPLVGAVMVAGIYALRQEPMDVVVAVGFGVFALVMQKTDFPPLNFIVGMLLGSVLEGELVRSYATFRGRWELLLERPIFLVLVALFVLALAFTVRSEIRRVRLERDLAAVNG